MKTFFKGYTLIELTIYVALMLIVGLLAVLFFTQFININETNRRNRASIESARQAMGVINQEIRHAVTVYDPTSAFGSSPGQLSLETTRDLPSDESSTYVDLYLDGGKLFIKRESQTAQRVTSEKVNITNLTFTKLTDASGREGVKTNLTAEYTDPIRGEKNEVTLVGSASLRDN